MIVDDYGHHPAEVEATLDAAQTRLRPAASSSRSSRTATRARTTLFDEFTRAFNKADVLFVTDIYAAGENADRGRDRRGARRGDPRARPPRRALRARTSRTCDDALLEIVRAGRPRHRARRRRHQRERARASRCVDAPRDTRRGGGTMTRGQNRKLAKVVLPDVLDDAPSEDSDAPKPPPRWLATLRTIAGFALVAVVSLGVAWGARRYLMTISAFFAREGRDVRAEDAHEGRPSIARGDQDGPERLFDRPRRRARERCSAIRT